MPSVRALHHPAFLQRRAACHPLWPSLHCAVPPRTRRDPPNFQGVRGRLRLRKARDETRPRVPLDIAEADRSRHPVIQPGARHEDGDPHPQRIHQPMPLAPFDFLAAILPALRAPALGGLDRLASKACGTGGGRTPRVHTRACAEGFDHLGPGPIVAPRGKRVIGSALGQSIMRSPIPLAPTAVERVLSQFLFEAF